MLTSIFHPVYNTLYRLELSNRDIEFAFVPRELVSGAYVECVDIHDITPNQASALQDPANRVDLEALDRGILLWIASSALESNNTKTDSTMVIG